MDVSSMFDSRKTASLIAMRRVFVIRHYSADHLHAWRNYLRIEKDYLRLGKTINGLKKTIYSFEVISAE